MARIRSIKPDFFTSETIAALPLSARLTFIGLWTYVDDNGVGLDNALLVTAAVWPLESDTPDTLERTRDDLARIARKGLISRYQDSRKRYLHVTSWDEHQRVDHPGKPRYPLPGDPAVTTVPTCDNADESREDPESSRDSRESVAPEQGAGSREQGAGSREVPATPAQPVRGELATAGTLVAEWIRACRKRPPDRVIGQISAEVRKLLDEGQDPSDISAGLEQWRIAAKHPSTLASFVNAVINGSGTRPVIDRREQARSEQRARQMARAQEREKSG